MRHLNISEQAAISAGNIVSDFQNAINDGVDSGERTLVVASAAGGLVIGGLIGAFGATVLAGGIVAGYLFLDWANG